MLTEILAQVSQVNIAPVQENVGLFHLMQRGGWLMGVLFVCSVVAD